MSELRPDVIALTDSFDLTDSILNSSIGSSDGNVYEKLFKEATKSVLNRVDPFEGYEKQLRPHLDIQFLKHHNKLPTEMKPKLWKISAQLINL